MLFILGLVLSGATAIPLETELDWLVTWPESTNRANLPLAGSGLGDMAGQSPDCAA